MFLMSLKNLLCVCKFTCPNDVSIEFHISHLFVKDLAMRDVLLRGCCQGVLYSLDATPINKISAVFVCLPHNGMLGLAIHLLK
jgi:hypothetical protein